jgi:hypothetical protein|tara:strand:+ start:1562 stop:1903 length:342 start_codon:yes stop_codon:yes gene_type:complete
MAWDDTKKEAVIQAYEEANPTPETSVEIVKEIAEEYEESPNGVRMILTKAGVYIRKTAAASNGSGSPRVSKAQAQDELTDALTSAGQTVDGDIISKLTGKAAKYFAGVISSIS